MNYIKIQLHAINEEQGAFPGVGMPSSSQHSGAMLRGSTKYSVVRSWSVAGKPLACIPELLQACWGCFLHL